MKQGYHGITAWFHLRTSLPETCYSFARLPESVGHLVCWWHVMQGQKAAKHFLSACAVARHPASCTQHKKRFSTSFTL